MWFLLSGLCACLTSRAAESSPAAAPATNKLQIDLPAVLRLAGAQNLDIKIARQSLAEAQANAQSADWQFLPWITPGFGWKRHDNFLQDVGGSILDVHKESYSVGPTISGQLDLGDAIYKRLAARQLVKAANFSLAAQQQDTLLSAAQDYFDLLKAQAAIGVAQEAVRISSGYGEQVQQAVGAGVAFKGDVLRVQVETERNRLTLRQAQERQESAAARLAQTLHLQSGTRVEARTDELVPLALVDTNALLEMLVSKALGSRPELSQIKAVQEAARDARNGALYGPLIPSVGAQVFVGGLGGGKDGSSSKFGESEDYQVSLGWRIGPGGLLDRGRIRAGEARLQIAELNRQKLLDDVTRQVIEAHSRLQSLSDQLATARRAVQAAEDTLQLTRQRKEFAVGAVLENIQAEQELTRTRLDYLNAIAEYDKAQYGLKRAVGMTE